MSLYWLLKQRYQKSSKNSCLCFSCVLYMSSPLQTPCAELYWGWPANTRGQQEACDCQHRHEPCQQPIPRYLHHSLHQGHKSIYPLLNAICLFVCTFVQIAFAAWSYHLSVCIIHWAFSIFCVCWGGLGNDTQMLMCQWLCFGILDYCFLDSISYIK